MANSESMLGKCFVVYGLFASLMYTVPERNYRIREITC